MKIGIVDDDREFAQKTKAVVQAFFGKVQEPVEIQTVTDGKGVLEELQEKKDFKIIRITSITLLVVLLALILFFFIGTYISAKYIDQEVWPGDLFVDEVKVQENCMQLKGNLYPTMNFYQAMKYEIQNDCMYITLYKSMISRRRGDTCSVNIVISDERLENVKYIYAVGRGKEKLIYAQ